MSLWATATGAVDRHRPARPPGPLREQATANAPAASTASDVAAQLIRYIPTELVAAYATVIGILPISDSAAVCRSDYTSRWSAFAVFVILTPVTLQVLYVVKRRQAGSVGPAIPWFDHVAALVAFLGVDARSAAFACGFLVRLESPVRGRDRCSGASPAGTRRSAG
jgi:hypothetical protein